MIRTAVGAWAIAVLLIGSLSLWTQYSTRNEEAESSSAVELTTTTRVRHRALKTENTKIPKVLWFTHPTNILETKSPIETYDNVMKTVTSYIMAWPDVPIKILTDEACKEYITRAEPELLPHYDRETDESRKADMCRVSALHGEGGYAFSTDLQLVHMYKPKREDTSFVAAKGCLGRCFNQAFLASQPNHSLLRLTLDEMLRIYHNEMDTVNLGPLSMQAAYQQLPQGDKPGVYLLEELQLDTNKFELKLYPEVERQHGQGVCNLAIHDPRRKKAYFYANFVGSRACRRGVIPQKLWFTHSTNVLETKEPRKLYENVQNTASKYRTLWNNPDARVRVLDDDKCREVINLAEPKLIEFFDKEANPTHRADICRLAVLWQYGGYFIDTDWQVVEPYRPHDDTTFVTVRSCRGGCFDTGFVASTAKHPILERNVRMMMWDYEHGDDTTLVGPVTMANAFYDLNSMARRATELLDEEKLDVGAAGEKLEVYPELPRQPGTGAGCNNVVHDPKEGKVHFFTHFPGYGGCEEVDENGNVVFDY